MISDEGMRGMRNRNRFGKQDFRSFRDIGFDDYHNNEDLLMSSTELKARNTFNRIPPKGVKHVSPDNKPRDLSRTINPNIFPAPKKFVDRLPVTEDEIKHILTDLKSIDDETKLLSNGQMSKTDPPAKTGVQRVRVGEIRLRPQQLRSLLANSKIAFEK